jgi:hypothetical protein
LLLLHSAHRYDQQPPPPRLRAACRAAAASVPQRPCAAPSCTATPFCFRPQDQFDSIDLSDNAIVRLEGFPRLPRLKVLLLNNNRIAKIGRHLEASVKNLDTLVLTNNKIAELRVSVVVCVCVCVCVCWGCRMA